MNKYVAQLLEVIQKKTGCDTSGAVRWLANQAGVSERTAWYWKQQEKLRKATEKNLGRIAEEMSKMPHAMPLNVAGRPVFLV